MHANLNFKPTVKLNYLFFFKDFALSVMETLSTMKHVQSKILNRTENFHSYFTECRRFYLFALVNFYKTVVVV